MRELKRQIGSLYFERSSLSKDKEELAAQVKAGAEMNNRLFVSKYQLGLPSCEEIQRFVEAQIREHG